MGFPNDNGTSRTVLEDFLRNVERGQENVMDIVKDVADGKEKITVCLGNRALQPEPPKERDRAESPRRWHEFHAMEGFCEYLKKNKGDNMVVFAHVEKQEFAAVLNDKAARGFEIVTMRPQVHPLWLPWDNLINESPVGVKDFAKFLLSHRRQLTGERAREVILDFSQVRAASAVTLESGVGKHCVNGLMIETKIQGAKGSETFALPDSIFITAPLFVGLDPQTIEIDILLDMALAANVSGVVVTATSADAETKTIEAFDSMVEQLKSEVDGVVVAMGRPDYMAWDYVTERR